MAPASVAGGDCEDERADSPGVSSISKLKLSRDLAVACSFDAFFRNATKKEAAGAARGGCQVGELGLASATALVGWGNCYGRCNGHGHGSPALVDLEAAPRQSSSTSPSALPLMRRSALGQGQANAKCGAPVTAAALSRMTTRGDDRVEAGGGARRGGEGAKRG